MHPLRNSSRVNSISMTMLKRLVKGAPTMHPDMLRRYAAEFLGTFALVFFGCGTRIMVGGETQDFAGILMVHIAFGFTIAAMIYTVSHISGAHFNPAITLGFATARRFPWRYVLPYWIAQ